MLLVTIGPDRVGRVGARCGTPDAGCSAPDNLQPEQVTDTLTFEVRYASVPMGSSADACAAVLRDY